MRKTKTLASGPALIGIGRPRDAVRRSELVDPIDLDPRAAQKRSRCVRRGWFTGVFFLVLLTFLSLSCTPNPRIVESVPTPTPPPAVAATPKVITLDDDLQAMQNADFKFILVFKRKDDEPMNAEDKAFVNENTPYDTNRRKLSDDGKAIIVGSNFPFVPGTIGKLTDRFVMEDHSRSDAGPLEVNRPVKETNANKR